MGIAKSKRFQQGRKDRKHQLNQIRENKKAKILEAKRSIGGPGRFAPPLLTAVINLGDDNEIVSDWLIGKVVSCDEAAATVTRSQSDSNSENKASVIHLSFPRFKRRFAFITPDRNNLHAVLDACKICDSVIFIQSNDAYVENDTTRIGDDIGAKLFSAIIAQGLPADPVFVFANKTATGENITEFSDKSLKKQELASSKNLEKLKKNWQRVIEKQYPNVNKIYTVGTSDTRQEETECILLLRHLSSQKRRPNSLRDHRPHLMAESASFEDRDDGAGKGTLKVEGYVRCGGGNSFLSWSVNRLIHIPGWGDFQISKIDSKNDPHPLVGDKSRQEKKRIDDDGMSVDPTNEIHTLAIADPNFQEQLIFENEPDIMDGEQTWPTEEELNEAALNQNNNGRRFVKVPKGMGEYQAAWIIDKEEQDDDDDDEDYDEDMEDDEENQYELEAQSQECSDDENEMEENNFEDEEYETISISNGGNMDNYDEKQESGCKTLAEEQEAYLKLKAAREDALFPDEVDTPLDIKAKARFARYRGLKSFRTSPWDPKENLPQEYARIFQFENFDRTKKRVYADLKKERKLPDGSVEDEISIGTYVTLYVKDVPKHLYNEWRCNGPSSNPLVVYNILPHEQKMCVLNLVIKRAKSDEGFSQEEVIKSKERLIFHVGYRRFTACPIFSQHTNGSKHKYVRYWHHDDMIVMTVFAPIMFPPANVLVYKAEGGMNLVGSGSLLSADPDRIIIKRAVLSGAPFKVHKKSAVVRFMFFNREDIEWFKPVELHTKRGNRGHIKVPLGTHGHMKVHFDGCISQQDTVLLNLYKRMYPKWNYNPIVNSSDYARPLSRANGFEAAETLQLNKKKIDENAMFE